MQVQPLPELGRCRVRAVGPPERPPHEPLDPGRVQTPTNFRVQRLGVAFHLRWCAIVFRVLHGDCSHSIHSPAEFVPARAVAPAVLAHSMESGEPFHGLMQIELHLLSLVIEALPHLLRMGDRSPPIRDAGRR